MLKILWIIGKFPGKIQFMWDSHSRLLQSSRDCLGPRPVRPTAEEDTSARATDGINPRSSIKINYRFLHAIAPEGDQHCDRLTTRRDVANRTVRSASCKTSMRGCELDQVKTSGTYDRVSGHHCDPASGFGQISEVEGATTAPKQRSAHQRPSGA